MSLQNSTTALRGSELLQERLNDPQVAEGLARLLDRVDSVSFAVEAVEGFVARGDTIADSVAHAVGELKQMDSRWSNLIKQTPELMEAGAKLADATKGIDLEELKRSQLLERLSDPQTLSLLNGLLDNLPLLAMMIESLQQFIGRSEVIAENVADAVHEWKLDQIPFDAAKAGELLSQIPRWQSVASQVIQSRLMEKDLPKALKASADLVDSGMLDEQVVKTLGRIGRQAVDALNKVNEGPIQPVGGLWGMMRASKDPDVQKTVGFAFAFAKEFAKHLQ